MKLIGNRIDSILISSSVFLSLLFSSLCVNNCNKMGVGCFRFPEHVESGLIDVIGPHPSFYPDLNNLKQTFGDAPERVRWRSKQNLDFAFLMMYSQPKATFYVQLEDDILAKKNCVTTMKSFALDKIAKKEQWFVLVFCQLGFIGKWTIGKIFN